MPRRYTYRKDDLDRIINLAIMMVCTKKNIKMSVDEQRLLKKQISTDIYFSLCKEIVLRQDGSSDDDNDYTCC